MIISKGNSAFSPAGEMPYSRMRVTAPDIDSQIFILMVIGRTVAFSLLQNSLILFIIRDLQHLLLGIRGRSPVQNRGLSCCNMLGQIAWELQVSMCLE